MVGVAGKRVARDHWPCVGDPWCLGGDVVVLVGTQGWQRSPSLARAFLRPTENDLSLAWRFALFSLFFFFVSPTTPRSTVDGCPEFLALVGLLAQVVVLRWVYALVVQDLQVTPIFFLLLFPSLFLSCLHPAHST